MSYIPGITDKTSNFGGKTEQAGGNALSTALHTYPARCTNGIRTIDQ
jgi:hypothetical protein